MPAVLTSTWGMWTPGATHQYRQTRSRHQWCKQASIEASAPAATASDDEGDSDEAADGQRVQTIEVGPRRTPEAKRTRLDRETLNSAMMPGLVDDGSYDTPLDRHLQSIGVTTNDPGRRLARSLAEKDSMTRSRSRGDEATASLAYGFYATEDPSMKQLVEEFDEFQTFFAERVERPAAKTFTYTKAKQKKSLEKGHTCDVRQGRPADEETA